MPCLPLRKAIFPLLWGVISALIFSACSGAPPNSATLKSAPAAASSPSSISAAPSPPPVQLYTYKIINVYPHHSDAFTEGLVFDNGSLYEGTGMYKESSLRRVDLASGRILQNYQLPEKYWGEGITVFKDTLIQLTYQTHIGFVYHKNSFELLRQFTYPTEGWGLTTDGGRLIMSDGSSRLYFRDPVTLEPTGSIEVTDNGSPVNNINELEYINGRVYANIWLSDRIAIIEPQNGRLSGWFDLTGLLQTQGSATRVDVLNGIAFDPLTGRLFITGKWWPHLFEIQQVEKGR
jgi:glutaminyl-peptide cyclotransferase